MFADILLLIVLLQYYDTLEQKNIYKTRMEKACKHDIIIEQLQDNLLLYIYDVSAFLKGEK